MADLLAPLKAVYSAEKMVAAMADLLGVSLVDSMADSMAAMKAEQMAVQMVVRMVEMWASWLVDVLVVLKAG
jgi:uncharacterized protein YutE (UPF0331/DUF86 family)